MNTRRLLALRSYCTNATIVSSTTAHKSEVRPVFCSELPLNSSLPQLFLNLFCAFKLHRIYSVLLRSLHIRGDVVGKEAFFRCAARRPDRCLIDLQRRLHCPDLV